MLNANYISLFGMKRVDVMIRQKFLNDLRDLEEINDCFRRDLSDPAVEGKDESLSIILKPRTKKKDSPNKQTKLSSPNKNSKKEDPKNSLEKKTNANVYFWYYKDPDPEQRKQFKQKQKPVKLPTLNNVNARKRRSSQAIALEQNDSSRGDLTDRLSKINENEEKSTYLDEDQEMEKENHHHQKQDQRPSSSHSVYSNVESEIDFGSIQSKRRLLLKTAQLRELNVSEKFIEEAKKMVYFPSCKSFHPIEVTKYVSETIK